MDRWEVSPDQSGVKLIHFLSHKLGNQYSRREIKRAIEKGASRINGRSENFASHLVGSGDVIEFVYIEPKQRVFHPDMLFEDEHLVIYNKPSGVVSEDVRFLRESLKLIHRLDKDTTGILMFAKHSQALESMKSLFKSRKINKKYLAIVDGAPIQNEGIVDNFLGKLKEYQGQAIWGEVPPEKGLHAITRWSLFKKGKDVSVLVCYPETGRTHQIRVHVASLGHPILGDIQYGHRFRSHERPKRVLLHAWEIEFQHPLKNQRVHIEAPVPEDMGKFL